MTLREVSSFSSLRVETILSVVLVVLLLGAAPVQGEGTQGRIFVLTLAPDNSFKDRPFTVSAICDGRIVFQDDGSMAAPPNKKSVTLERLPLGTCDVRVESEGMITEVKRGVQIFEQDRRVEFVLRAGEGLHMVELAEGGLAREEVAARLRSLEGELERVKSEIKALTERPGLAEPETSDH